MHTYLNFVPIFFFLFFHFSGFFCVCFVSVCVCVFYHQWIWFEHFMLQVTRISVGKKRYRFRTQCWHDIGSTFQLFFFQQWLVSMSGMDVCVCVCGDVFFWGGEKRVPLASFKFTYIHKQVIMYYLIWRRKQKKRNTQPKSVGRKKMMMMMINTPTRKFIRKW